MLQRLLVAFALCIACGATARGEIIVDTFNPGDTHRSAGGSIIGGSLVPPQGIQEDVAFMFIPRNASYMLGSIKLGISRTSADTDILDVQLHNAGTDGLPGDLIEAFEFSNLATENSSEMMTSSIQATSSLNPILIEDQRYWLVASARGSMKAVWGFNSFAYASEWWSRFTEDGSWTQQHSGATDYATFRIEGTLVPEPSTLILAGLGAAALLAHGLRRCPLI